MDERNETRNIDGARQNLSTTIAYWSILIAILLGILALIGWQFNVDVLRRPLPNSVAMNPLTALLFVFTGCSFLILTAPPKYNRLRVFGYIIASLVIVLGTLRTCWPLLSLNWRIDHVLFSAKIKSEVAKGLISGMALNTAIAFVFSGIGLFLIKQPAEKLRKLSQVAALAVFTFGFFSITGYLYNAPEFYDLLKQLPMAIHSALGFLLVSLALLFINPQLGFFKEFLGASSVSYLGRVLLFSALTIPVILGALAVAFYRNKLVSAELVITLLILLLIGVFCGLILYFVLLSNKKDQLQKLAEGELHQSQEIYRSLVTSISDYAIFVLDVKGNILTWNKGAEVIKGYGEAEVIGKSIDTFYTQEDRDNNLLGYILNKAKEEGSYKQEGIRVRKDGSTFWADGVVTALYNDAGDLTGFAALDRDNTERKKAKDLLSQFNEELSIQLEEQTTEIRETTTQLRQLAAHLQTVREEERKRIAREIHDELSQMLTGLRMDMVWIRKRVANGDEVISERFDRTLDLLSDARQEVRRLATDLHPALLEHLGLAAALKVYAKEFAERMGIDVKFEAELNGYNDIEIAERISIGIYRIFQEALTNVAKHAAATRIEAFIKAEGENLILRVKDNGKGFNMNEIAGKGTLGIVSMRERALMMNGEYKLLSLPSEGTTVLLTVPIKVK